MEILQRWLSLAGKARREACREDAESASASFIHSVPRIPLRCDLIMGTTLLYHYNRLDLPLGYCYLIRQILLFVNKANGEINGVIAAMDTPPC